MKTSKKYNNKEIMRRAWELRRTFGLTMGEAMKAAWSEAKAAAGVTPMDKKIQEYFDAKRIYDAAKAALDAIAGEIQDFCLYHRNRVVMARFLFIRWTAKALERVRRSVLLYLQTFFPADTKRY